MKKIRVFDHAEELIEDAKDNPTLVYNLIILLALTLFGKSFSKLELVRNLYLHDILLLVGLIFSFLSNYRKVNNLTALSILSVSLLYLSYSLLTYLTPVELIVRQFALFFYLGGYYFLNLENNKPNSLTLIVRFLIIHSVICVVLQLVTIIYQIGIGDFDPFNYKNHYWFSPAVIIGLITASASALLYIKSIIKKIVSVLALLVLAWTTGHASAQLAILSIVFVFFLFYCNGWKKGIPIAVGLLITLSLFKTAPQFKDSNGDWRLLIWEYHLTDLIKNKFAVAGNGFGVPYINQELEVHLYKKISSTALQEIGKPDERYLSGPHNSFVTIAFAIGLIPSLLIFLPYLKIPVMLWNNEIPEKNNLLIILSLVGQTIWCSLNVVLELPHCAGFFWLVYFTYSQLRSDRTLHSTKKATRQ